MILKNISFSTPIENLLYDEVLLHLAEKGIQGEVLRLWEASKIFIVLGRICKPEDDLKMEAIRKDQIPVLRRSSGGGTVLQGKGCLNYSLILSKEFNPVLHDLRKSYQLILGKVAAVLEAVDIQAEFHPISDIALKDSQKKISGNSQKRGRRFILHHGTILYDFDLPQIERYLKMPKDVPAYRQGRSHLDFVANAGTSSWDLRNQFKKVFNITKEESVLTEQEKEYLKSFSEMNKTIVECSVGDSVKG